MLCRETATDDPVWNVVCFLAHQAAEMYLKAFLDEHDLPFEKTHDLVVLLDRAGGRIGELDSARSELAFLSPLAVSARYPGAHADREVAHDAVRIAAQVRTVLRRVLGIQDHLR